MASPSGLERAAPPARRRRVIILTLLGVLLVAAAIGFVLGLILTEDDEGAEPTTTPAVPAGSAAALPGSAASADWAAVLPSAAQGVVEVVVRMQVSLQVPPGFPEESAEVTAVGTGTVLDADGHVLTNQHVVDEAQEITVHFPDGASATATVLGEDASTDLAVLQVADAAEHLHPLTLASSFSLVLGQPVAAIGSPFGYDGSASTGIVSGLGREITSPNGYTLTDAIQTDAALNHGNSGGPLLDANGVVVGISAQIAQSGVDANVGVAFAIPIDEGNLRIIAALRDQGRVDHAWLGVAGTTIDPTLAAAGSLQTTAGVLVTGVVSGSPADTAGLRAGSQALSVDAGTVCIGGDAITALDGEAVTSMNELQHALESAAPGTAVEVTVVRADGSTTTLELTLGSQPAEAPEISSTCS